MTTTAWWQDATFYSIYPLGYCDAPRVNDGTSAPTSRIELIASDLERIADLGFSALYLSPVFESGSHGYDTHDYFSVDRRLGTDDDLAALVRAAHERGIRVVLDGVYNHVGRGFRAFERLRRGGEASEYRSWFRGVDFTRDNRFGDGFVYEGWEGVDELVALDHSQPAVREHLFEAAGHALDRYGVDGIRLDVAYSLPLDFLDELSHRLREKKPDVRLVGEVIHGDYPAFVRDGRLHGITNYECYKGLWSSFNDHNMHEIGYSLNRLFGDGGLLEPALRRGHAPLNFADNHDVSRLATTLTTYEHVYPAYALLWTMPGIPSVYYGSEYGMEGRKHDGDHELRPRKAAIEQARHHDRGRALARYIRELNAVRGTSEALRSGAYRQIAVASGSLVFERFAFGGTAERVLVAVNADPEPITVSLSAEYAGSYRCLYGGEQVELGAGSPVLDVPGFGSRILRREA
ncbi:MAG: alpha-amylase family glycosyl hydrolase [Spirochaetota bacterium]